MSGCDVRDYSLQLNSLDYQAFSYEHSQSYMYQELMREHKRASMGVKHEMFYTGTKGRYIKKKRKKRRLIDSKL